MLSITEDIFGSAVDPMTQEVNSIRRFTFTNDCVMVVQVITLGATITSIQVPDKGGKVDDVVLGYDDIASFLNDKINPYFGATVGRVANRIGNGRFKIDGVEYAVSKNYQGKHTLHGGAVGFNKAHWTVQEVDKVNCVLVLQHVSPDNDQGFPGEVTTTARFQLSSDNRLTVKYTAKTTKPTVINMTNHAYFNLAGHQTGSSAIYDHLIAIKADKLTLTDADSIPTGEFLEVKDTAFDFRELKKLGAQITKSAGSGFDQNYCCNLDDNKLTVVARAVHLESGRYMEVSTDQPGVQFYTSNFLPDTANGEQPFPGKGGASYSKHGAFCFEPQGYPDAVNHSNFPNTVLRPGKTYEHTMVFQFGLTQNLEKSQWLRKF